LPKAVFGFPRKVPCFQLLTFQADTGSQLKPVEPCWTRKHRAATKLSTVLSKASGEPASFSKGCPCQIRARPTSRR